MSYLVNFFDASGQPVMDEDGRIPLFIWFEERSDGAAVERAKASWRAGQWAGRGRASCRLKHYADHSDNWLYRSD